MPFQRFVTLVRERWHTALVTALIAMGAAVVTVSLERPVYEASASVFVRTRTGAPVADCSEAADYARSQFATYVDLTTTPLVLDPVIDSLGLDTDAEDLATRISSDVPEDTLLLTISVRSGDAAEAAGIANAVAESLRTQVARLEGASGPAVIHLTTVTPAVVPDRPVRPDIPFSLALGVLIALLAGTVGAIVRGLLDDTVRTRQDLTALTDLPVLATVPEHRGPGDGLMPLSLREPLGPHAEAHRELRMNLRYLEMRSRLRSVLVTSTVKGEGASTTAFNLANTLARDGRRVLLIEADLRSPSLGPRLGLALRPGLTTALLAEGSMEDFVQPLGLDGLSLLASGPLPPNPGALLDSDRMTLLLKAASARYDTVIVDAPPVVALSDSAALALQVSGTVLVVGSGRVRRRELIQALRKLHRVGAPLLGVALTCTPRKGLWAYSEMLGASTHGGDRDAIAADGPIQRSGRRRRLIGPNTFDARSPTPETQDPHTRKQTP